MKYQKICKCCGKPFETNSPQKLFCDREHYLPCPVCGKLVLKKDRDFTIPPKCCSNQCKHILRKSHFKERNCIICGKSFIPKSGVQIICNDKHYKKCEICGQEFEVDNGTYLSKTTCSDACTREKLRRMSLEKYGTEHPMQNKEVQKHHREAMMKKYGVEYALQNRDIMERQQRTAYSTNMKNNGVPYACLTKQCIEAQGKIVSKLNKCLADKIQELGYQTSFERRLDNMSFDICIESQKILIEIDPTYTHNSFGNHYNQPRDKYYQRDKSLIAKRYGYKCIHIFDWDDQEKVVSILKPKERVYARDCRIFKVFPEYGNQFLRDYHLQGTCRGQLLFVGLEYEGQLLQLMTFGKSRFSKNHDIELLRLCTLPDKRVIGGASKLFKWAVNTYELDNIVSYCDLSKFSGDVYTQIGMKLLRITPPAKVWSKGKHKITDNLLRQRGYDQLFKTTYGKGSSNEELMIKNGWLPVYDCGQAVFEYRKNSN